MQFVQIIIRLAADGLWYSEYLGVGRLSPELREKSDSSSY